MVTDRVGRARRLSGTLSKITRTGRPSSRNTSMRCPIFSTTPPLVASTSRLLARLGAGGGIDAHDGDRLADRLFHELGGRQQIEIEVLLDDGDVARRQRHGLGTDLGRDVLELDALAAALHVDVAPVLHQREIIGINRDRQRSGPSAERAAN